MTYDFSGKKIAVVGIARSGMAAAAVLTRRGSIVTLYDGKSAEQLVEPLALAHSMGVECVTSTDRVRDADIAVVSPGVRRDSPIVRSIGDQGIQLWGEIEAAYRIAEAPILAVTGTNGKTTTALLLAEMLRCSGIKTFAAGNIAAGSLAQPLIAAADAAQSGDAIVAEISSFQLETIQTFRPAVSAILNITPDHQDRQTWGEYVSSKWRMFENLRSTDTAVISSTLPIPAVKRDLVARVVCYDQIPKPNWIEDILLPGVHNRLNVLAAYAMASAFNVPEAAIIEAATTFRGVVHRLEYVADVAGVKYVNNSMCTNNAAFVSSLEALPGRKIVIAGGVFKGGDMGPLAGALASNGVSTLIGFGRSGAAIVDTVRSSSDVKSAFVDDLSAAVSLAARDATEGDLVILNPGCASFDQFRDFEHRGDVFKQLVLSLSKDSQQ